MGAEPGTAEPAVINNAFLFRAELERRLGDELTVSEYAYLSDTGLAEDLDTYWIKTHLAAFRAGYEAGLGEEPNFC